MSIKNPVAYCANLWDWACLKGCFGDSKISPSDADGEVERNGQILILECKSPGKPLEYGQMRMLRMKARTGFHTVIVIWGKPGQPVRLRWFSRDEEAEACPANLDTLRQWVAHWYNEANKLPPVPDDPKWYDENVPPPDMRSDLFTI